MKKTLVTLLVAFAGAAAWFQTCAPVNNWPITNARPTGSQIIAFGDSLTDGRGLPPGADYPAILSQMIGKPILNMGESGDTTAGGLNRLGRDVLNRDPRIVLLCLGGNDMLRKGDVDRQFQNMRTIIDRIHETGALVILIGVEGSALLGHPRQGPRYLELARETGCVYVPDILDGIIGRPELLQDAFHPNAKGNRLIAERLRDEVGEYLLR